MHDPTWHDPADREPEHPPVWWFDGNEGIPVALNPQLFYLLEEKAKYSGKTVERYLAELLIAHLDAASKKDDK